MIIAAIYFVVALGMFFALKYSYHKIEFFKNIYVLKGYLIVMCSMVGLMSFEMFLIFGVDIFSIMFAIMAAPIAIVYPLLVVFSKEETVKNIVQTRFVEHYDTKLW